MTPYQYANLVSNVPKDFMYQGFDFTVIVVVVRLVPVQSCPDDGSSRWYLIPYGDPALNSHPFSLLKINNNQSINII